MPYISASIMFQHIRIHYVPVAGRRGALSAAASA
jgi:hypothetical protein